MAKVTLSEKRIADKVYDPVTLDTDKNIEVTLRRVVDGYGTVLRCSCVRKDGEKTEQIGTAVYNEARDHASVSINTLKGMTSETVLEAMATMTEALTLMMAEIKD